MKKRSESDNVMACPSCHGRAFSTQLKKNGLPKLCGKCKGDGVIVQRGYRPDNALNRINKPRW